jgi:hypothetical protein
MRDHGLRPFQGIKSLFLPVVLGSLKRPGLIREIDHPVLGKGGPDDIASEVSQYPLFL